MPDEADDSTGQAKSRRIHRAVFIWLASLVVAQLVIIALLFASSIEFRRYVCRATDKAYCYGASGPHPEEGALTRYLMKHQKRQQ